MPKKRTHHLVALLALLAVQTGLLAAVLLMGGAPGVTGVLLMLLSLGVGALQIVLAHVAKQDPSPQERSDPQDLQASPPDAPAALPLPAEPPAGAEREALEQENEALRRVVGAMDSALRRLASGDLQVRLAEPFPDENEALRGDFNRAVTQLEDALQAIARHAAALRRNGCGLQTEAAALLTGSAGHSIAVAGLAARTSSLLDGIASRETEIAHLATIAHTAALDLHKPKQMAAAASTVLGTVAAAASGMEPAADRIIQIALAANMAAMKLKIAQAEDSSRGPSDASTALDDVCRLAQTSAEAARDMAILARQAARAAAEGETTAARCVRELAAMALYVQALQERSAKLKTSTAKGGSDAAALRSAVMVLAKGGREQFEQVENLSRKMEDMVREITLLEQQAGRFTPVTAIQPHSVFKPQPPQKPKRPPHLQLVKS